MVGELWRLGELQIGTEGGVQFSEEHASLLAYNGVARSAGSAGSQRRPEGGTRLWRPPVGCGRELNTATACGLSWPDCLHPRAAPICDHWSSFSSLTGIHLVTNSSVSAGRMCCALSPNMRAVTTSMASCVLGVTPKSVGSK